MECGNNLLVHFKERQVIVMKKIIISVAAAMVFSMSTSYAGFEFSEKDIVHADRVTIQDGLIVTYDVGYMGSNMEEYHTHFQYWDLSGNKASEPLSEETPQYFTYNRQSIVEKTDDKNILKDTNGNIILSELPQLYNARSSRTRVIYSGDSDNVKYGLMAYDGRIIIPMQYDRLNIISDEYYLAGSDEANIIYNYYGDIILEIPSNIMVTYIGSAGWMCVRNEENMYALMDINGDYLTDFSYNYIWIFDNDEDWQSGSFAQFSTDTELKYVNRKMEEIDIYSDDAVYCKSYADLGGIAIIYSASINQRDSISALYNKETKEYIIPYSDNKILYTINGAITYLTDDMNYLLDYNGDIVTSLGKNNAAFNNPSDGFIKVRSLSDGRYWLIDTDGNVILSVNPESYLRDVYMLDNNEFVVNDGGNIKILTAKGIIGEALNTDIKLSINGVTIPCKNINGYVVITAEQLGKFGFDVVWNNETRMLYITRNPEYRYITYDGTEEYGGEPGTHFSDIYGTDINVEFNGKRINSYSIGGEMLIRPEDMAGDGISIEYNDAERMLYMNIDRLEQRQ